MSEELELDISAAVDEIGAGLGFEVEDAPASDDVDLVVDPLEAPTDPVADPDTPADPVDTSTTPEPVDAAPKTWRKEAADVWATLPPAAKAEVLKREEDMFKGLEGYKDLANSGKAFRQVMDPYMPVLQQYGIDPMAQIGSLMKAHHTLALGSPGQKADLFRTLARDYGVDLTELAGAEAPWVDPAVVGLQKELQEVKSLLSRGDEQKRTEALQAKTREVEAFAADPAHPYFDEVAPFMATLMKAGTGISMKEAYEQAVWATPTTRAKEQARQQADTARKAREEAAAKADAARRATGTNVRTSAKVGSAAAPLGSMDDTISSTLAAIKARG